MTRLALIAPMLVFGFGGIYLLVLFLQPGNENRVYDNLVPELIGFCLEGFFLIGLFSWIQARRERERKEDLRLSLRGALREILSYLDIGLLGDTAEPASSRAIEEDSKLVAHMIMKLAEHRLDVDAMARIKAVAQRNLTTIHDLIPVAAQLSAEHIRWWLAITDSVRQLSEATDSAAVAASLHRFLANLGEFDELEL
ncbi:MAG: hypothetical protein V2I66_01130 [Halieaceae bacterium]|nr:hypothetical protein [Halieaceae bacterium]